MFLSQLCCQSCGSKSERFGDAVDLLDNCYYIVLRHSETGEIVVRRVNEDRLAELGVDLAG